MGSKSWRYGSLRSWGNGNLSPEGPGLGVIWAWESVSHIQAPGEPLHLQTGLGFAHVVDGAGLSLLAPTVSRAMEYDVVLLYETKIHDIGAKQVNG